MNKSFHIIGASGHAKVILEMLELHDATIAGITDSNPIISRLFQYDVSPSLPSHEDQTGKQFIIAIGNNKVRREISGLNSLDYGIVVHPSANLSTRTSIGKGSVVMAGVSINSGCWIGEHCIINTNVSVDHECRIDSFVHLSPNAALAGNVIIGEGAHIGIGASIIPGVSIGKWATIGAGAAIITDVPDYAVVVGVPGKIIRYNEK